MSEITSSLQLVPMSTQSCHQMEHHLTIQAGMDSGLCKGTCFCYLPVKPGIIVRRLEPLLIYCSLEEACSLWLATSTMTCPKRACAGAVSNECICTIELLTVPSSKEAYEAQAKIIE